MRSQQPQCAGPPKVMAEGFMHQYMSGDACNGDLNYRWSALPGKDSFPHPRT